MAAATFPAPNSHGRMGLAGPPFAIAAALDDHTNGGSDRIIRPVRCSS
jgi:hypothetical protein